MPPLPPLDSTAVMNDDDAQNANDIRNEQVPEDNNTIKNDNFQPTTTTTHPNETHIKKRSNRAICKHPSGCTNQVVNNSLCVKHGAVIKRCSTANCTNYAQVGGVCTRHGAKKKIKLCLAEGCQNQVRNGGVCRRHGARDGRDRNNNNGGGEKRTRQSLEIISVAEQTKDKDGSAMKKTATRSSSKRNRPCTQEGCPNQAYSGGVCRRHGAKVKLCSFGGCSSQAKKGGVCVKHRTLMMSSSDTAAAAAADGDDAVDGNVAAIICPVVVKPSGDHGDATSQDDANSAAAMSGPVAFAAPAPQSIQKVSQSNNNLLSKPPPLPPPLSNPKSIERKRQCIQKTLNNNFSI